MRETATRSGPWMRGLMAAALLGGAFAVGQLTAGGGGELAAREHEAPLGPQGRGAPPPPRPDPEPLPTETPAEPLVYGGDNGGVAGAANGFIAVTGSYGVGTSVLYVLDTVNRQLAVYEARGGSAGSRRLFLVGARRIDLDLQLEGYNDDSEFSHRDLARRFEQRAEKAAGNGRTDTPKAPVGSLPGATRK